MRFIVVVIHKPKNYNMKKTYFLSILMLTVFSVFCNASLFARTTPSKITLFLHEQPMSFLATPLVELKKLVL